MRLRDRVWFRGEFIIMVSFRVSFEVRVCVEFIVRFSLEFG